MHYFGMRYPYGEQWDREFRSRFSILALASKYTVLHPHGDEFTGRCPLPDHVDRTPSFSVNEKLGLFNCFGCGRGGTAASFLQQMHGMSQTEAYKHLHEGGVALHDAGNRKGADDTQKTKSALAIWNEGVPIIGTPAADYFDNRAISFEFASQQENIRFARLSFDRSSQKHPAVIAAARNANGDIVAIQRIYLTDNGQKLAPNCKRSLGPTSGAAVRIYGIDCSQTDPENITLCEGIEDALSIARCRPDAVVWATLGTANLAKIQLPDTCKTVTLAHDNDEAGRQAATAAVERFGKRGLAVELDAAPPAFKDFNEWVMHYEFRGPEFENPLPWRCQEMEPDPDLYDLENTLPSFKELRSNDTF